MLLGKHSAHTVPPPSAALNAAGSTRIKTYLLCDSALRVHVVSTAQCGRGCRCWMGVPSAGSPHCHLRSRFTLEKKKVRSPKIWRIIFYSTYGRLKGLVQLRCETPAVGSLPTQSLFSSAPLGPPHRRPQWVFSIQSQLSSLSFLFFSASIISL